MASDKIFLGKPQEQIKNKLGRLVTKYNDIKEKKNKTGREAQAKWKQFKRIDALFETRENHNLGFLVDSFSNDIELFNSFKGKQEPEENLVKIKNDQVNKKRKLVS